VVNFNSLIIKIFKSHGFEINSSSDYSKYILASKDNINLSVGYSDIDEEISVTKVRNFFRAAKKDNADRVIYIIPNQKYSSSIDKFASDRKIQLWDRERLEHELGRAILERIDLTSTEEAVEDEFLELISSDKLARTETKIPEDSETTEIILDAVPEPDTGTTETVPIMVPFFQSSDESEPSSSSGSPETTTEAADVLSSLENTTHEFESESDVVDASDLDIEPSKKPLPEQVSGFKIVKPAVSKDKAASMANKIVRGFRFNLELIPYYLFSYTCTFETDSMEDSINEGLIGINGLTSNIETWTKNFETTSYLDEEHTKLEVKFPYEKAVELVRNAVVELNTRLIETRDESESTVIFERKKLKPKSDAIEILNDGLYYLPVWCIEGSNGLMIIDASSGKIIKEDFF
jgi:hypothetical protein